MDFEYIDESEVLGVKRGRKSTVPQALVEALAKLPVGKAVVVKDYALDPKADNYKTAKATVSSTIRQAGRMAGREVAISWTEGGIPQVSVRATKAKAKAGK